MNFDPKLKRRYTEAFIIIATIFFLFFQFKDSILIEKKLDIKEFSFNNENVNKLNKWSIFKNDKDGTFSIHTGENDPVKGILIFNKNLKANFDFSIKKSGLKGEIQFSIIQNGDTLNKAIVTLKTPSKFKLSINKGDKIQIIADKYGKTSYDHGNLKITYFESEKFIIIPILWTLFFIFLFKQRYLYFFIYSSISFILIMMAELRGFDKLNTESLLNYSLFVFGLSFLAMFINQSLNKYKKYKLATILNFIISLAILTIPLCILIYTLNFDIKVTKDTLFAIFQSNSTESLEYILDTIEFQYTILFLITIPIFFFIRKQESRSTKKVNNSILLLLIAISFSVLLFQTPKHTLYRFILKTYNTYNENLSLFKDAQIKRKSGKIKFNASKKKSGETYIVIIGESLSKKHMGLYGYHRNTTPNLSKIKNELIVFDNAYSNHTHTMAVITMSHTEANQYNRKDYNTSLSIIELLNKANFETYWLTNQLTYGPYDNLVSVLSAESKNIISINSSVGKNTNTANFDEELIKEVRDVLKKRTAKNKVIFVHLMGNHSSYKKRYPTDKYSIYEGELNQGEFGAKASKNNNINHYDNSVVYNDYVVSAILKELQKSKEMIKGFMYMSDHAEDVLKNLGHNSSKFTYEMTQIPMIAWFSKGYKNEYPNKYTTFLNNADKLFSNDLFYDTMVGVFDIDTDNYSKKYDLTNENYHLNPKDALVLHGRKKYIGSTNYKYWQKFNAEYLSRSDQSNRVFPHRVNSLGKLKDIWRDGFRSFEIDVIFGLNGDASFQVGHHKGVMGVDLETFLSSVNYKEIKRIWLDFKNLNKNNYKKAITRLEYLDDKFKLKSKIIFETGTKESFLKEIKNKGWHTSYYLPTNSIVKLLKEKNSLELKKIATKIAEQVSRQDLLAVSFDQRLYPFVKKYLESNIADDIVYHIWYAPDLHEINFKEKLIKRKEFQDVRVKTILTRFRSDFNL